MSNRRVETMAALSARPRDLSEVTGVCGARIQALGLGDETRDGRVYVPAGTGGVRRPLMVLLHGAGADASSMLRMAGKAAAERQMILLAPDARKHTWDYLVGGFGPDVAFLDKALRQTFARCAVDGTRIAVAGFSDGASYALTLGLANGDLFTHVIAFSPGFMRPPRMVGAPKVFVSHGTADEVLPIDLCSRRIVPQLEAGGYDLRYTEFRGTHTVPDEILTAAMDWFLED